MTATSDPTGVLVLRVWSEASEGRPLRFRITRSLDVSEREHPVDVEVTTSIDEAVASVRRWIDEYASRWRDGRVTGR